MRVTRIGNHIVCRALKTNFPTHSYVLRLIRDNLKLIMYQGQRIGLLRTLLSVAHGCCITRQATVSSRPTKGERHPMPNLDNSLRLPRLPSH